MNKVVVFDYDDTLVRAKERIMLVLRDLYGDDFLKLEPKLAELLPMSLESLYKFLLDYNCEQDSFDNFSDKLYAKEPDKSDVFDWVPNLVEDLKSNNYELIICSFNKKSTIEANLERLDLKQYFSKIITLESGFSKTKSNIIQHLGKYYESQEFSSVLIGDSSSDLMLARNSNIGFIDVKNIEHLSRKDKLALIKDNLSVVNNSEKNKDLENNLILSQYSALRQELLSIQESEEKIYGTTLLAVGALWSALLTILYTKDVFILAGVVFVFPAFYSLTSLSKYVTNGLRVANISSFIAMNYSRYIPTDMNWELRISQFSSNTAVRAKTNLNSSVETASVYQFIFWASVCMSIAISFTYFLKYFVQFAIDNFSFEKSFLSLKEMIALVFNKPMPFLSLVDLLLAVAANTGLIYLLYKKVNDPKKRMSYATRRKVLNELWAQLP